MAPVVSVALAVAEREVLRFVRTREAFWLAALAALALLLPLPALVALQFFDVDVTRGSTTLARLACAAAIARNLAVVTSALILIGLAASLGTRSVRAELESRSWALLRVTLAPPRAILLGKLAGSAAVLAGATTFLAFFQVLYTPFLRLGAADVLLPPLVSWLLAVGVLPDALAEGAIPRSASGTAARLRAVTLLRLAVPLLLWQLALSPELGVEGATALDAVIAYCNGVVGNPGLHYTAYFAAPWVPWAVLLAWHLLTAVAVWRFFTSRAVR